MLKFYMFLGFFGVYKNFNLRIFIRCSCRNLKILKYKNDFFISVSSSNFHDNERK